MAKSRLLGGFFTVGFWTLASRVLGFVRDILIASFLGTGPMHQAFVIAFSLPNLFRRFFAEGAFNMAFVPLFSKKLESGDHPADFARDAFSGLAFILILLTIIAQIFMPALVYAMASGFAGQEQFDLTVAFGRVAFPYIFFISLAALLSGVLNANRKYAAAAAAPVLLNVIFVIFIFVAWSMGRDIGWALIWAVPLAGLAQMALVWWAAKQTGFALTPRLPRWTPELKKLTLIAAPAALAGGVVQINLLIGRQVASYFDGAVSWLYNADRLYQLPLGVVGIAVGIVLLPELSRQLQSGNDAGGKDAFSRATEMSMALVLPSTLALVLIPVPLIEVLFQRGAFTADDTAATAAAVLIYGLGLPAFVLQKTLQPLFFAREDTKRPFYYALVALVVNAAVAIGLASSIGFLAAALGTTLAGWMMVALLWAGARKFGDVARIDARARTRIWRMCFASAAMGGALYLAQLALGPIFGLPGWRYLALFLLVSTGIVAYAIFGSLFRAFSLRELKSSFKRGA
ncbi:MAG: murein biosynthesis integral membrane protein MurJ [Halocynthiibacter sp.]